MDKTLFNSALLTPYEKRAPSPSGMPLPIRHAPEQSSCAPHQRPAVESGVRTRPARLTIKDVPRLDFSCKAFRDANGLSTDRSIELSISILRTRGGRPSINRAKNVELTADVLPGVFSNYSPVITAVRRNATSGPERSSKKLKSPDKFGESAKSGNALQRSRPAEAEHVRSPMSQFVSFLRSAKSDMQFQFDLEPEFEKYRMPLKALFLLKNKIDFGLLDVAFQERFDAIAWSWIRHENPLFVRDFRTIFGQAVIEYAVLRIQQGSRVDIAVLSGWNILQNQQLWRDKDVRMETNHSLVS